MEVRTFIVAAAAAAVALASQLPAEERMLQDSGAAK